MTISLSRNDPTSCGLRHGPPPYSGAPNRAGGGHAGQPPAEDRRSGAAGGYLRRQEERHGRGRAALEDRHGRKVTKGIYLTEDQLIDRQLQLTPSQFIDQPHFV